ncbi:Lon protease family protein [Lentiprolixibacter aurantiacus]|uniref:endopeptidase La n=1 Tax=Lentiprolixibacter aurantiacus TaxID=2993939 RepID=A0AAE3MNS8_9FLAO|nr:ATP-binding protein [Lentiprolixibacter aurantiacus]MCX2720793.1 ATP-binding protein [Lentiprolixibacter aurantiacus]
MIRTLTPSDLRKDISKQKIDWKQLKKKEPSRPLIGQERALKALEFGIGNKRGGFNIYVSGYPGSGKSKAVNHFLEEKAKLEETPGDWCYVNNFQDSFYPKKLKLPNGGGQTFKLEVQQLILEIQKMLINAFESKEYHDRKEQIIEEFRQKEKEFLKQIHRKARENNFTVTRTPIEILVIPTDREGTPLSDEEFNKLNQKERDQILAKQSELKDELFHLLQKNREIERESNKSLFKLDESISSYAIDTLLEELQEKYIGFEDVLLHLSEIKNDIISNLHDFLKASLQQEGPSYKQDVRFQKYEVNVITDNTNLSGAPIVLELNPTLNNLFGKLEHESYMGTLITNFTLIRGGALHRANGGYLIIPLKDLLFSYFSWESLKRALKNNEIIIEDAREQLGIISAKSLKPEPIPLEVQVILIGSPRWYYLLYELDEDFKELFKVKAEFDTAMDYSLSNIQDFAGVTYKMQRENDLYPINNKAMGRLIEHASRMADDRKKISIKFREIRDILHEADHYARTGEKKVIDVKHIEQAIEARYFRSNLIQEKINELIKRGHLMIDLTEYRVGQINGISILDLGDISFGKPNKITVSIASGKVGLIDIEREAKLSGPIHTKGTLILQGYLLEKYGQDKPVSLYASLVFEQSYSEIDGDSASCAELFALLSSLADLPINQGIAVTGSINQKGELQPVGAINQKIEGFFEVCAQRGLSGKQGVIIPRPNLDNLMLKKEVVAAVEKGLFSIWAVDTVDDGLEIITGFPAGKRLKGGSFSTNSVHCRVDERIRQLNANIAAVSASNAKEEHLSY